MRTQSFDGKEEHKATGVREFKRNKSVDVEPEKEGYIMEKYGIEKRHMPNEDLRFSGNDLVELLRDWESELQKLKK